MSTERFSRYRWLLLAPVAVLYMWSAPHTVQNLDSGEMVAAALRLTVPHPPGYPLATWWHHLVLPMIPGGSAYHRAAICSCVYMVCAMALLMRLARGWLGAAFIAGLATAPLIWLYAVIPDVFALHLMLSAGLVALAFTPSSTRRTILAGLTFGLGAANHHTIIFLAPLLALIVWEEHDNAIRFWSLFCGALLSIVAYASILLMDTGALYSWRDLRTFGDVLHHFLRRDYGTFRLSGRGGDGSLLGNVMVLLRTLNIYGGLALTFVFSALVLTWRRVREHRAWWALAFCLVLYVIVFFPRLAVRDAGAGVEVAQRFLLFPILLLGALAVSASEQIAPFVRPRLQTALAGLLMAIAVLQAWVADVPDLRRDTVIEEYARNLLTAALTPGAPSLLYVYGDTQISATRYVQAVDASFDSVAVVSHGLLFDEKTLPKLRRLLPNLYDATVELDANHRKAFADFLVPNSKRYAVTHIMPGTSPGSRTIVYPIGRRLVPGEGIACAVNPPPRIVHSPEYMRDSEEFVESKQLFATYAAYDLERSRELVAEGDHDGAKQTLVDVLAWIPFCIPCKRDLCALETVTRTKEDCLHDLAELEAHEVDYMSGLNLQ